MGGRKKGSRHGCQHWPQIRTAKGLASAKSIDTDAASVEGMHPSASTVAACHCAWQAVLYSAVQHSASGWCSILTWLRSPSAAGGSINGSASSEAQPHAEGRSAACTQHTAPHPLHQPVSMFTIWDHLTTHHTRACCSRCVMLHAHADCASCSSCYRNARAAPAASASVAPAPTRQGCLTRLRWGSCSQHHQSHQNLGHCGSSSRSKCEQSVWML